MSSFWNSPAWSMAKRPHSAQVKKNLTTIPGPGNYNVSKDPADKVHGWKMGTASRNNHNAENVPGPGKYDSSYKNSGPKITMGIKPTTNSKDQNVPGPGNYEFNDKAVSKTFTGFTMGAKYGSSKDQNLQPGPGSYNIDSNSKSGVKIGTSNRQNSKLKESIPGPGMYGQIMRPQSAGPKYSFGAGEKTSITKADFAPGPGQYNYEGYNSKINGVTLGQRTGQQNSMSSFVPGPGQYESILKRPMSGTKIGKAERNFVDKSFAPGPGAYDSSYNAKKGTVKIGTGDRTKIGNSLTPGPGAYDLIEKHKGGVTISGVKGKKNIEITPGPGAYDAEGNGVAKRPCSAKIGSGLRSKMDYTQFPGPGAYNLGPHDNWKFAYTKELRSKDHKGGDPGPGQYDIPATVPSVPYYDVSVSKLGKSRSSNKYE